MRMKRHRERKGPAAAFMRLAIYERVVRPLLEALRCEKIVPTGEDRTRHENLSLSSVSRGFSRRADRYGRAIPRESASRARSARGTAKRDSIKRSAKKSSLFPSTVVIISTHKDTPIAQHQADSRECTRSVGSKMHTHHIAARRLRRE